MKDKGYNAGWLIIEIVFAIWMILSANLLLAILAGIMMVSDLCAYEWKTNPTRYPPTISSEPDVWANLILLIPFSIALILLLI